MKQIRLIPIGMVCAVVACLFASCASDDAFLSSTKGEALTFSVGLDAVSPMEIDTRSVRFDTDTIFAGVMHQEEVEVSMGEISRAPLDDTPTWVGGEAVTVQVDGRFFQYTIGGSGSSSTLTSAAPYYFTNLNTLTANAWYPSTDGAVVGTTHSVSASQNNDANFKNSDFLYGSASVVHSNTTNSISLSHKIAKVRVTVNVANPSYLNNSTVNGITLSGTKRSGNVAADGALTATGDASDIAMHKLSDGVFEACIIPQNASLTFKVNVGGAVYTAEAVNPRDYEANNVYTAIVNISASKLLYYGEESVAVGDYYASFANGQAAIVKAANLATAYNSGATPIAVVFSDSTSAVDKANGWNLGYAMALRTAPTNNVNANCVWGPSDTDTPLTNWDDGAPLTTWALNIDGYTDTWTIGNNAAYPAIYYAINYNNTVAAPPTSSKWYLPSNGQLYNIAYKIGGMSKTPSYTTSGGEKAYDDIVWSASHDRKESLDYYVNIYINNINALLTAVDQYTTTTKFFDGQLIWTSTERNIMNAFASSAIASIGNVAVHGNNTDLKSNSYFLVRPVLAF
ncbi:MAG: fimbrillin family protein [Prevotella sp.]|nr:fimbrillin family protein [Prevotella sp.]